MITRLRAQNFKSWKDTGDLRLAPLTGIFGANSSGKTSILQALLVLKQSSEFPDPRRSINLGDEKSLVDLGTFSDVIHGHDIGTELSFSLSWRDERNADGRLDAAFREDDHHLRLSKFLCRSGDDEISVKEEAQGFTFSLNEGVETLASSPWGFLTSPPWDPTFSLRLCLESVHYLGSLRQRPRRAPYVWSGSTPSDVGPDGGEFAQAILATLSGQQVVGPLTASLKRMKLIDDFRVVPIARNRKDYEIRVKNTRSSTEVLLPDVGFGVSQILPILVLCYSATKGSTLVIEQPELHLHPAAQSELADVLIEVVKERRMQVLVESHSEHLLRRLQRRIAEDRFPSSEAALYFCQMENGESKATPLEITGDGFIRNWPKDFFGDEMGDLSAMTEAAAKRHLASTK